VLLCCCVAVLLCVVCVVCVVSVVSVVCVVCGVCVCPFTIEFRDLI